MKLRALALAPPLALAFAIASPSTARADGWWETACNSDGLEGDGGCSNPDNPNGCNAGKSASHRAASVGSGLALFAFVGYRIGRKRRRK